METAAWNYPEPLEGMEALKDLIAFHFDALDEWLEEDEPVIGHPRDPYHRIDVNRSSRRVKVSLDGKTLAESDRPIALFETGLPTRWYLPREDVNMALLEDSDTRTTCAYKGHAATFSVGGHEDVAWTYVDPTARSSRSATGSASTTSSWTSSSTASRRSGPSRRSRSAEGHARAASRVSGRACSPRCSTASRASAASSYTCLSVPPSPGRLT